MRFSVETHVPDHKQRLANLGVGFRVHLDDGLMLGKLLFLSTVQRVFNGKARCPGAQSCMMAFFTGIAPLLLAIRRGVPSEECVHNGSTPELDSA